MSLENMLAVADICHKYKVKSVLDASLLQDNVYFMKTREAQCKVHDYPRKYIICLTSKM